MTASISTTFRSLFCTSPANLVIVRTSLSHIEHFVWSSTRVPLTVVTVDRLPLLMSNISGRWPYWTQLLSIIRIYWSCRGSVRRIFDAGAVVISGISSSSSYTRVISSLWGSNGIRTGRRLLVRVQSRILGVVHCWRMKTSRTVSGRSTSWC